MNDYASLDTAIEIMAYKIADCVNKVEKDKKYEKELEKLRNEREEMYSGNVEMINKIVEVYGKELREIYQDKQKSWKIITILAMSDFITKI